MAGVWRAGHVIMHITPKSLNMLNVVYIIPNFLLRNTSQFKVEVNTHIDAQFTISLINNTK